MNKMGPKECPKCGDDMRGPFYIEHVDRLRFSCPCGYWEECAPLDRRPK